MPRRHAVLVLRALSSLQPPSILVDLHVVTWNDRRCNVFWPSVSVFSELTIHLRMHKMTGSAPKAPHQQSVAGGCCENDEGPSAPLSVASCTLSHPVSSPLPNCFRFSWPSIIMHRVCTLQSLLLQFSFDHFVPPVLLPSATCFHIFFVNPPQEP